ncbi:RsmB/NOP family class I SAM-dependent RNA methyltransferase [Propionibacteriaceae bacterium Y1923]
MTVSPARRAAYDALLQVETQEAFANLALAAAVAEHGLDAQQAATATELVNGTARLMGTYDRIIARAARRELSTLEPAVVTVLRLSTHEQLSMRTPVHAAVDEAVNLGRIAVGHRVTGVINAIARKVGINDLSGWVQALSADEDELSALGTRTHHPRWIADVYDYLLGDDAEAGLLANNTPAVPTLVVRPGLVERDELSEPGLEPTPYSPFGFRRPGNPGGLKEVRQGRAGVQDEGSQLMAWLLALAPTTREIADLGWLDLCAGPGGKAALLAGLARQRGGWLLASEKAPHRAELVRKAMARYPDRWQVITADGLAPAWQPRSFARVMADVPCTGIGSLRRRSESRWRRTEEQLEELVALQAGLLAQAWAATAEGGVLAYVTCSPHPLETVEQVQAFLDTHPEAELLDAPALLPDVPEAAHPDEPLMVQLWPHRHGTDAMFGALLRRGPST